MFWLLAFLAQVDLDTGYKPDPPSDPVATILPIAMVVMLVGGVIWFVIQKTGSKMEARPDPDKLVPPTDL